MICISSIALRIYEKMLLERSLKVIPKEFWYKFQMGFRQKKSGYMNIACLLMNIESALGKMKVDQLDYYPVLFVDLVKAFDKLPIDYIIYKLIIAGIRGNLLKAYITLLRNRSFRFVIKGCISDIFGQNAGCPQGSLLGPLIFLIYINDMQQYLPAEVTACLFADDVVILPKVNLSTNTQSYCFNIAAAANGLTQWAKVWRMNCSPSKTQIVPFTVNKQLFLVATFPDVTVSDFVVKWVERYVYMGIIFAYDLNWKWHFEKLESKVRFAVISIARFIQGNAAPNFNVISQLLLTVVYSLISYGLGFWTINKKMIIKLHALLTLPIRLYLKMPKTAHRYSLLCDVSMQSMEIVNSISLLKLGRMLMNEENPCQENFQVSFQESKRLIQEDAVFHERSVKKFTLVHRIRYAEVQLNKLQDGEGLLSCDSKETGKVFVKKLKRAANNVQRMNLEKSKYGVKYKEYLHTQMCLMQKEPWNKWDVRKVAAIRARLRHGLSTLGTHMKHRHRTDFIGALCKSCQVEETLEHMLYDCPDYAFPRGRLLNGLTKKKGRWKEVEVLLSDQNELKLVVLGHWHDYESEREALPEGKEEFEEKIRTINRMTAAFLLSVASKREQGL
jgi:hypothetical protein